jgi:hypothetical protein
MPVGIPSKLLIYRMMNQYFSYSKKAASFLTA